MQLLVTFHKNSCSETMVLKNFWVPFKLKNPCHYQNLKTENPPICSCWQERLDKSSPLSSCKQLYNHQNENKIKPFKKDKSHSIFLTQTHTFFSFLLLFNSLAICLPHLFFLPLFLNSLACWCWMSDFTHTHMRVRVSVVFPRAKPKEKKRRVCRILQILLLRAKSQWKKERITLVPDL